MLKNAWYAAAFSPEIAERLLARRVLGEALVFYRTRAGDPVALADRCPHRSVPLSLGKLVDDTVRCTYHGIRIADIARKSRVVGTVADVDVRKGLAQFRNHLGARGPIPEYDLHDSLWRKPGWIRGNGGEHHSW